MIKQVSFEEISSHSNFSDLLEEYAQESAIPGLPHPRAKFEIYEKLDKSGLMRIFASFHEDILTGFITVLYNILPHYGVSVSVGESFFVSKQYRKTGAGIKLKYMAEKYVDEIGSPGLLLSSPVGGILADILENSSDYIETNRVFFRKSVHV